MALHGVRPAFPVVTGAQQRRTPFGRSRSVTEIRVALKRAYDLRLVSLRDEDAAGVVVSMGELSDR